MHFPLIFGTIKTIYILIFGHSFNEKLLATEDNHKEHDMHLPTMQLNSKPLKIIFWLRSLSKNNITLQLKRIQNCKCVPMETRVGFNQFRYLYRCPHRRLINLTEELLMMKPNDLVAITMMAYFYIFGEYVLSYELRYCIKIRSKKFCKRIY